MWSSLATAVRIRYRPVEKKMWLQHLVRGFVLTGRKSQATADSLAVLERHWSRVEQLVSDRPAAACPRRAGLPLDDPESAGEVRTRLLELPSGPRRIEAARAACPRQELNLRMSPLRRRPLYPTELRGQ